MALSLPVPAKFDVSQPFVGQHPWEPAGYLAPSRDQARNYRMSGWTRFTHLHKAQDIACPVGTPLRAPARGIIVQQGINARFSDGSIDGELFQFLQIRRTSTSQTLLFFTHLNKFVAKVGERVAKDELISRTGRSGRATGPHLHWEVLTGPRNLTPWAVWNSGSHWDPKECLPGGELAGRAFLIPNV